MTLHFYACGVSCDCDTTLVYKTQSPPLRSLGEESGGMTITISGRFSLLTQQCKIINWSPKRQKCVGKIVLPPDDRVKVEGYDCN